MYHDESVNKTCLLKKFLNDVNNIRVAKHATKSSRRNLKFEKPFALPMRPKDFNKEFIMQLDGDVGRSGANYFNTAASPHSKIVEPEVNILVENRSVRNCISFTKVHTSAPVDNLIRTELPPEINFGDIVRSRQIDQESNLTRTRFQDTNGERYTHNQFIPDGFKPGADVKKRKTIYDYAAECTIIDDINEEEQYTKLKAHLNNNILEKLDLEYVDTSKRCQKLLNKINQYRKFDILDKCPTNETALQFHKPKYNMTEIQKLLSESPSIKLPTLFTEESESTFFELETVHNKEVLWIKPRPNKKRQAMKEIQPRITNLGNTTFFEKLDVDREFLNFFSMQ